VESRIRCIFEDGRVGQKAGGDEAGVRPALFTKKTKSISGLGTWNEPYSII
jgi:hypothetical protein